MAEVQELMKLLFCFNFSRQTKHFSFKVALALVSFKWSFPNPDPPLTDCTGGRAERTSASGVHWQGGIFKCSARNVLSLVFVFLYLFNFKKLLISAQSLTTARSSLISTENIRSLYVGHHTASQVYALYETWDFIALRKNTFRFYYAGCRWK